MNLVTVIGARPQFIKAAAVSRAINVHNNQHPGFSIHETIIHTGQHYDEKMSAIFFEELELPDPHHNLGVGSGSHGYQTGQMLEQLETLLHKKEPDLCMVYGDTNSTLAGALAAAKLHIPVAHIEAGLRSFNKFMPEEINRILTDHVSDFLFCPTKTAIKNLKKENIKAGVYHVGDVMYDCAKYYSERADNLAPQLFKKLNITSGNYLLSTIHRAENTDNPDRLRNLLATLNQISSPELPIVFPLHPRTKKEIKALGNSVLKESIRVENSFSYLEMICLEKHAKVILTDSGGVQKEAFFFNIPCITLRKETEWVETVTQGLNWICDDCTEKILGALKEIMSTNFSTRKIPPLFGSGNASSLILNHILDADSHPI